MSITNDNTLFTDSGNSTKQVTVTGRDYLIFVVHDGDHLDLKLGVDAYNVEEILNDYTITYLPMVPGYVRGIFNMRGQILPAVDMRLLLDKPADTEGLLVVLNYNDMKLGVLVDAVDKMINIDDKTITPVPAQDSQRFVSGMCTIPDNSGTLMVLDCDQLFSFHG